MPQLVEPQGVGSRVRFPTGLLRLFIRVDSASNRNAYQGFLLEGKGGRCIGLTTLPPSCSDCLGILGGSNSLNHKGLSRPV